MLIVSASKWDATNIFEETHGEGLRYSLRILNQFFIGFLDSSVATPGTSSQQESNESEETGFSLSKASKASKKKEAKKSAALESPDLVETTSAEPTDVLEPYPDVPPASAEFLKILRQITAALHVGDEKLASGERAAEMLKGD